MRKWKDYIGCTEKGMGSIFVEEAVATFAPASEEEGFCSGGFILESSDPSIYIPSGEQYEVGIYIYASDNYSTSWVVNNLVLTFLCNEYYGTGPEFVERVSGTNIYYYRAIGTSYQSIENMTYVSLFLSIYPSLIYREEFVVGETCLDGVWIEDIQISGPGLVGTAITPSSNSERRAPNRLIYCAG